MLVCWRALRRGTRFLLLEFLRMLVLLKRSGNLVRKRLVKGTWDMVLLVLIGSFSRECCGRFWVPGNGRARVEVKLLAQGLDEVATRQILSLCA